MTKALHEKNKIQQTEAFLKQYPTFNNHIIRSIALTFNTLSSVNIANQS